MSELDAYINQLKNQPQLAAVIAPLIAIIEQQSHRIAQLEAEVAQLRSQLNQNSQNSHKPPSSEGYARSNQSPAFSKRKTRRRGGQPGHRGHTLNMVADADTLDEQRPAHCLDCGHPLMGVDAESVERRQVFSAGHSADLPEPRLMVHEYRRPVCRCPGCGERNQQPFPASVTAPVQYGARVWTLSTLLHNDYNVPVEKVSQFFRDVFGYRVNEATVLSASGRSYQALEASEALIAEALKQAPVLHVDETGLRCAGRLHWLHVASTKDLTHYFVDARRGFAALTSPASVLPDYTGHLVHDCWSSYFRFGAAQHSLCGAHLIRELRAQAEQGADWAASMMALLFEAYETAQQHGVVSDYHQMKQRYFALLRQGLKTHPIPKQAARRGRKRRGKARSLIWRLIHHHKAVWAFARASEVPFTNNQAERDLRMVKAKQKVNGGFGTVAGAEVFARIRGFCSTVRKQGKQVFKELSRALQESDYVLFHPAT
jgi:transposase